MTLDPENAPALVAALPAAVEGLRALNAHAAALPGLAMPAGWHPFGEEGAAAVHRQADWLSWAAGVVTGDRRPAVTSPLRQWLTAIPPRPHHRRLGPRRRDRAAGPAFRTRDDF